MGDADLVVHGHFYQPPRENPWTEQVTAEPSAGPYHDWNERITAECYRPNGWARVVDEAERLVDIVNCYELLSFNVGPTLLSWLEEHHPEVYDRIRQSDRATGHAISQAYGHAILPLCNERDLRTQVRWGIADFVHRFGRPPEGMWLPETAVSDAVLSCLAEEGIGFTILAPGQIEATRALEGDGDEWYAFGGEDAERTAVLRWRHPGDPALGVDLVVYDGPLSHGIAFAGVSSEALVARATSQGGLVVAATDGETFGHHRTYAERGLAYALAVLAPRHGVGVPRLAARLREHPPHREARVRLSAWSCAHGVGRWMADCGCHTGGEPGWSQRWRAPLRQALDCLRDWGIEVFERRGAGLLADPWAARDAYIDVLLGARTVDDFAADHVRGDLADALTLLEAQRHALLMYTSCGWFFNDLAGLETVQILRYAARCVDLHVELGEEPPVAALLDILGQARSNRPEDGDGRSVWARHVEPSRVDAPRVAAHLALVRLLGRDGSIASTELAEVGELGEEPTELGSYRVEAAEHEVIDRGGLSVCAGTVRLAHRRTGRPSRHAFAALHLAGLEVFGAVRPLEEGEDATPQIEALAEAFRSGARVTRLLRAVVEDFGPREFGLESALPDAAGQIVESTAQALVDRVAATYDQLRSDHHGTFTALARSGYQLPPELRAPIELALARRFEAELARAAAEGGAGAFGQAAAFARAARAEGFDIGGARSSGLMTEVIDRAVSVALDATAGGADDAAGLVAEAVELVELARELGLGVDLSRPQERVFAALVGDGAGGDARAGAGARAGAREADGEADGEADDAGVPPLVTLGITLHLAVDRLGRPE